MSVKWNLLELGSRVLGPDPTQWVAQGPCTLSYENVSSQFGKEQAWPSGRNHWATLCFGSGDPKPTPPQKIWVGQGLLTLTILFIFYRQQTADLTGWGPPLKT